MYKIKQVPEDFIVKEISIIRPKDDGDYSYFLLKKKNYPAIRAIEHIAQALGIKAKKIGFAGNKDKNAVTEQVISFFKANKSKIENLKLRDIELKFLGKGDEPISLGDLEGNYFEITVRELEDKDIDNLNKKINYKPKNKIKECKKNLNEVIIKSEKILIPNYFGEQRFSKNNHFVGKAIVKDDFKKAVELILENRGDFEEKIKDFLKTNKNDYVGAMNLVPFKIRKLYVHAYQSYLLNKTVDFYLGLNNKTNKKYNQARSNKKVKDINKLKDKKIPIIGFGTETEDKAINKIINALLEKERVGLRDFIIKKIPDLSSEGDSRNLFFEIKNLKIAETKKDDLNKNSKMTRLSFSLKKGCYATVAIKYLFKD